MLQKYDPRNANILVNVNGQLVHRDKAAISPFDSSVQGGDAVWEGLRAYDGKIFRLRAHLDRLHSSAVALAFSQIPTREKIQTEIRRTLDANSMRDGVHIRLTLTRGIKITSGMDPRLNQAGSTLIVLAEFKPPVYGSKGISLITSGIRRFSPDCLDPKIHHCNLIQSILAKLEANNANADDAVMLDQHGFVAETNATHLFLVSGGRVETPLTAACPEGITRAAVLELCARNSIENRQRDISLMEFYRADEVFCTGTMGELVAVRKIDGRMIGTDGKWPVLERLQKLFSELVQAESETI
jgi:branched-chain amino acid aminotransferase